MTHTFYVLQDFRENLIETWKFRFKHDLSDTTAENTQKLVAMKILRELFENAPRRKSISSVVSEARERALVPIVDPVQGLQT